MGSTAAPRGDHEPPAGGNRALVVPRSTFSGSEARGRLRLAAPTAQDICTARFGASICCPALEARRLVPGWTGTDQPRSPRTRMAQIVLPGPGLPPTKCSDWGRRDMTQPMVLDTYLGPACACYPPAQPPGAGLWREKPSRQHSSVGRRRPSGWRAGSNNAMGTRSGGHTVGAQDVCQRRCAGGRSQQFSAIASHSSQGGGS